MALAVNSVGAGAAEDTTHRYTNRLVHAQSPYLLLHAHNPVDWYPWGPEAFEKARSENKPIFLSVGYSTCFWCHVAERTLYADPDIAALMNRWFVNVKVDREERPDVDHAYMLARQVMSGSGGWPNNVFLTPTLKPFYAGSYFPPERDEHGRPSFSDVLRAIRDEWEHRREQVLDKAEQVEAVLRRVQAANNPLVAGMRVQPEQWKDAAIRALLRRFDSLQGGFAAPGRAARFPQAPLLMLLLEEFRRSRDVSVGEALRETLDAMALGGIQDHLAGGFHRYSTDPDWSVPHFEKMLYDNAQLLRVYAEAHELFGTPLYADTARHVAHYLTSRMMAPDGGFYTAEDAQVDGVEGASYVWSEAELVDVLGEAGAAKLLAVYELVPVPHSPAARRAAGAPIPEDGGVLRVRRPISTALAANGLSDSAALLRSLSPHREALLARRDERKPPLRDEKLGVDLNGLAIDAFAAAGMALDDAGYVDTARRTAQRVWREAFDASTGTLRRQVFRGRAHGDGLLTDYAHLARGLLTLHAATGELVWRERARVLMDVVLERFLVDTGRLRVTLAGGDLPVEPTDHGDVEAPSATSAAVQALVGLSTTRPDGRHAAAAALAVRRLAAAVQQAPDAWPALVATLVSDAARPVILAANRQDRDARPPVVGLQTTRDFVAVRGSTDPAASSVVIELRVAEGYHVNANPATLDYLIPTRVEFAAAVPSAVTYPESHTFSPGFSDTVLDVYEGEARIVARFDAATLPSLAGTRATVTAQACNDTVCLPPSRIPFTIDP